MCAWGVRARTLVCAGAWRLRIPVGCQKHGRGGRGSRREHAPEVFKIAEDCMHDMGGVVAQEQGRDAGGEEERENAAQERVQRRGCAEGAEGARRGVLLLAACRPGDTVAGRRHRGGSRAVATCKGRGGGGPRRVSELCRGGGSKAQTPATHTYRTHAAPRERASKIKSARESAREREREK